VSGSLVTDDVGDTMTERPTRDSALSPSRDVLPGRARAADDPGAFDEASDEGGGGSRDGGR